MPGYAPSLMRRTSRPGARRDDSAQFPGVSGALPLELNTFVGRAPELACLAGALEESRLVTVTGMGGVGKSRLAARAAAVCAPPGGARLVELAAVTADDLLEYAVVEALALTDHTARPAREVLLEHFADRRVLLVVDGYEHLVDPCAALVGALLRAAPGLTVLAAAGCPLGLSGERVVPLAPLGEPDALALFTDRAAAVVPGFALDDAAADDAREVCHAAGRHTARAGAGGGTAHRAVPRSAAAPPRRPFPAAHRGRPGRFAPPSDAADGDRLEP